MSRIVNFGDLHLTNNHVIDKPVIDFLDSVIETDDIIIFDGDVFDSFNISVKNESFYNFLKQKSKIFKKCYIVTGNHDKSKGRNSMKIMNHFSNKIEVINNYKYVDISDFLRLHFYNYFRYETDQKFELDPIKKNYLFSHCDMEKEEDIKDNMKSFDLIFNGHIHTPSEFGNVINTGSIRMVSNNEDIHKRYYTINPETCKIQIHNFEAVSICEKIDFNDLTNFVSDKPTVLTVRLSGLEDLEQKRKAYENIDREKVTIREEKIVDKSIIVETMNNFKSSLSSNIDNTLDMKEIFRQYLKVYSDKFTDDFDKDVIEKLFAEFKIDLGNTSKAHSVDFISLKAENFKVYKSIDLSLETKGLTLIKGYNKDELVDGKASSNESGKSVLREILEFCLLGIKSGIAHPLTWGQKKGYSEIDLIIDDDQIKIRRNYTAKTGELHIWINDMNKEWEEDVTSSEKQEMFYNKYRIKDALEFILLTDTGKSQMFFSSRNSDRFKIFKELFPVIQKIADFVNEIKEKAGEIKKDYEIQESENRSILKHRHTQTLEYINTRKDLIEKIMYNTIEISNFENELLELTNQIETLKYSESDLIRLKELKCNKPDIVKSEYSLEYLIEQKEILHTLNKKDKLISEIKGIDIISLIKEEKILKDKLKDNRELDSLNFQIQSCRDKYQVLKKETSQLNIQLNEIDSNIKLNKCSFCGADIKDNLDKMHKLKNQIKNDLEIKTKEQEDITNNGLELKAQLDRLNSSLDRHKESLDNIQKGLSVWNREKYKESDLEFLLNYDKTREYTNIEEIDVQINNLSEYKSLLDAWNKYSKLVEELGYKNENMESLLAVIHKNQEIYKQIDILKINITNSKNILESAISEKKLLFEKIKKYNAENKVKDISKLKLEYTNMNKLDKILRGKKSLTFEKYFSNNFFKKVEEIFNFYLTFLFNRSIIISVTDMSFIFKQGNDELLYKSFSTGGKTKLNISLMLTINSIFKSIGIDSNFLYIDEFLDKGIDSVNIIRILELLKEVYRDKKVWIVSHKDNVDELVDNIIVVNRENGISEVKK